MCCSRGRLPTFIGNYRRNNKLLSPRDKDSETVISAARVSDRPPVVRSQRLHIGLMIILLDSSAIATAYLVASLVYLNRLDVELSTRMLASALPIYFLINIPTRGFSMQTLADGYRSAWRAGTAIVWASLLMLFFIFMLKISDEFSRATMGLGMLLAMLMVATGRISAAASVRGKLDLEPLARLHIFDGVPMTAQHKGQAVSASDLGIEPNPHNPRMLERLGELAIGIDGLVVHCRPELRAQWAILLKSLDIRTELLMPELNSLRPLRIEERDGDTSLVIGSGQLALGDRIAKRAFDLCFTCALLPALLPVLGLIALLIKLDTPGPVLFKQERFGLGNRRFKILKFRTMHVASQDEQARVLTTRDDVRVTRVGRFLRKTSLDELPQFLNVLIGDMSIVGPRPHAESATAGGELYWEIDPFYWHRHVVKPGITGLAQVRGHRGNTFEQRHLQDRLSADLEYVSNWSFANDLIIIARTIGVFAHKNAF